MKLRRLTCTLVLGLTLTQAGPALAWKPVMHEYLAWQAFQELESGNGTLVATLVEHETGLADRPLTVPPTVDALVRQAVLTYPAQYRAGVLGPDAYPDMLTGQSVIHPADDDAHSNGADAWLRRLWDAAYTEALGGRLEPLAFMTGFLTHAAGDMYAHTYVNTFAQGSFDVKDPQNISTHVVVEGFVGDRTPPMPPDWYVISIEGVEDFLYEQIIDVTRVPLTATRDLYDRKAGSRWSLPWIFGEIRSVLEVQNISWRNLSWPNPRKIVEGPLHAYRRAWQSDIDRGLRALPGVSTEVARSLFYNSARQVLLSDAGDVLDDYLYDHLLKMLGLPDLVADFAGFINGILDGITQALKIIEDLDPIQAIKEEIFNYVVDRATGYSPEEWGEMLSQPESFMVALPRLRNAPTQICPPAGRPANTIALSPQIERLLTAQDLQCKNGVEVDMALDGDLHYQWEHFTPALNTVFMSKLVLLDGAGRRTLMRQLGYPDQLPIAYSLVGTSAEIDNAMLGFMRSLDGEREWSNYDNQMVAHHDCYMYGKVFADQKGARADTEALSYKGGRPVARDCPDVASVVFDRQGRPPEEAVCGTHVTARVSLDDDADAHGAVVDLLTAGPALSPKTMHVAPAGRQAVVTLSIPPISAPAELELVGSRIGAHTDSMRVRPPMMSMVRAQRRQVGGYVNVVNGDAVLGGTDLRTEARLDCNNPSDADRVTIEACPLGFGACVTVKQPARLTTATYDATLPLPAVAVDTPYRVRGEFLGTSEGMNITVLATRVLRITLDRETASVGLSSQSLTATVQLFDAATQPEKVFLRYAHGLSGPRSVTVPAGQDEVSFSMLAQGSLLSNQCFATHGWVEAISEKDASAAGLNTGRERYAEIVLQQGEGLSACIEMMSPDPRLEHVMRALDGGPIPFPPILFEPEDGIIGPWN